MLECSFARKSCFEIKSCFERNYRFALGLRLEKTSAVCYLCCLFVYLFLYDLLLARFVCLKPLLAWHFAYYLGHSE